MKSPFYFIVKPLDDEAYITKSESGLIVNDSVEDHTYTQRVAEVMIVPIGYTGEIQVGDKVIVQHNTFRTQYDNQGFARPPRNHIKDKMYYIEQELIYGILEDEKLKAVEPYCFVSPIEEETTFEGVQEVEKQGKLVCIPTSLTSQGFNEGDLVFFKSESEYEFRINSERLYMMKANRILCRV